GSHAFEHCRKFTFKPFQERKDFIREHRLCDCCLEARPPHLARNCRSGRICPIVGCGKRHHPLLHPATSNSAYQTSATPKTFSNSNLKAPATAQNERHSNVIGSIAQCSATQTNRPRISLQVIPVRVSGVDGGQEIETYAFLDSGSDSSICLYSLADKLGITGKPVNYTLSTLNAERQINGHELQMDVRGLNLVNGVRLDKVWTTDRLPIAADSIPTKLDIKGWSHLNDIELPEIEVKDVTLLIGNDVPEAHWVLEERRGERKQPYGIRTLLGWTFIGPMGRKKRGGNSINFINVDQVLDSDSPIQCLEPITSQLHRMYNADFTESLFDTKACMSLEDRRAKAIMDSSVCLIEGHYQLALPWRYDDPCLPNNKWSALKRLKLLKRRLLKDPALMKKYKDTLDGYISQGHARRMPNVDSSATKSGSTWYLPHHPVIHSNKPEKVRVVFDCAAKYQSTSLNDQLLQGPDLNNTLVGVLLQFRKEPVAIVADIKQMFHQVKVKKADCDALRFLWWPEGDLSKDPADHQMLVHPFGATSSPSCAAYALKRTADDNRSNYDTHIVDTVYRNFYVDDCLKSVASVEEAKELVKLLPEMLAKGGFHLTKWISNCRES
ncbi:uncharacterized protein LOC102804515, partial [Saccoglossus kowalevskii]|uniref:Uncharacterized protein LOC102804515 n=1 Tax=Saccoglossus kowalevskii TaxID=10224 RepID=A0ABM0M7C7_SACKO